MEDPYKQQLQTIKDNVPKVHEAGRSAGYNEGYYAGFVGGNSLGQEMGYKAGYEEGQQNPDTDTLESVLGTRPTYADYMDELENTRRTMVDGINAQGTEITATYEDTMGELLPKVAEGVALVYQQGVAFGTADGREQMLDEIYGSVNIDPGSGPVNYNYLFAGALCNDSTFNLKGYDIICTQNTVDGTFMYSGITDIKALLEAREATMDFSKSVFISNLFRNSLTPRIPSLDFSGASNVTNIFFGCKNLHTVDGFKISEKMTYTSQVFNGCAALEHVAFSGTLNCNGMSVSASPLLDMSSLLSLLNILKDNSSTGTKYTVTLGTTNLKKLTDAEKAVATQKGWTLA